MPSILTLYKAALRCARAIISSSSNTSGIKNGRTIKSENFILSLFENEKIISRLVEILEMDSSGLKVVSLEILTRIASGQSSAIIDVAGVKLIHQITKMLSKDSQDLQLISKVTRCLGKMLDGNYLTKNFILMNAGNENLQKLLTQFLNLRESNHLNHSDQLNGKFFL